MTIENRKPSPGLNFGPQGIISAIQGTLISSIIHDSPFEAAQFGLLAPALCLGTRALCQHARAMADEWKKAVGDGDATKLADLVLSAAGSKPETALSLLRTCVQILEKKTTKATTSTSEGACSRCYGDYFRRAMLALFRNRSA